MKKSHERIATSSGHRRARLIALCVGTALAQTAAIAHADSGVGVDTVLGSALNNGYRQFSAKDPEGLGQAEYQRTPTGLLEAEPNVVREATKTESGWTYKGSAEAGALGGDADRKNAIFRKYKDLDNGFSGNAFGIEMEKPDDAVFFNAQAGAVGQKDQFYGAQFGRYNDWKVKLFYNETTHVFTDTFRNFWGGIGTGSLTTPSAFPPAAGVTTATVGVSTAGYGVGSACSVANPCLVTPDGGRYATTGNSAAPVTGTSTANSTLNTNLINQNVANNLKASLAGADNVELGLVRKKGGARFDANLPDGWKVFASYSDEKRKGSRPFGATWGGGGGSGNLEIVEPIDYDTHDFLAGVQFVDQRSAFNGTLSASLFRNHQNTMTFQNPFLPAGVTTNGLAPSAFTGGTFDLAPNNNFYNAKAEYSHMLPEFYNGRFTGVVSLSSMRQNDSLIPATSVPGVAVTYTPANATNGLWDSTASLSQPSANAKIDTKLVDLGLSLNPVHDLDVRGKVRHYQTSNSTAFSACNPQNGEWGRLLNDGTGGAFVGYVQANGAALTAGQAAALNAFLATNGCNYAALRSYLAANGLIPNAGNINTRSVPYEYKQTVYSLSGDYRLNRNNSLNFAVEREDFNRKYRERDKTWEDRLKLGYVNRSLEGGTVRLSFETGRKRGSTYNPDPYEDFYSVSLGVPNTAVGTNMAGWVHNIAQFRKYDLADRDQNIFNARINYALAENLDGGVSLQLKDTKYPNSDYGRNDHQKQNSANFDFNWRPSQELSFSGWYSYQDSRIRQSNVWPNACTIGTTYTFWSNGVVNTGAAVAGATALGTTTVTAGNWEAVCGAAGPFSPLYPTSRGWTVTQTDQNDTLGLGLKYDFGKYRLDLDYSHMKGKTGVSYGYNGTALGLNAAQMAAAGAGWPDMTFTQDIINANLLIPVDKRTTVRLMWRYEWAKVRDWHYDGVAANPAPSTTAGFSASPTVYLDAGPADYRASMIGAFLKYDF